MEGHTPQAGTRLLFPSLSGLSCGSLRRGDPEVMDGTTTTTCSTRAVWVLKGHLIQTREGWSLTILLPSVMASMGHPHHARDEI